MNILNLRAGLSFAIRLHKGSAVCFFIEISMVSMQLGVKMAKRSGVNTWSREMRKNLEFLVSEEGYPPKKIADELSVSSATIYLELKEE